MLALVCSSATHVGHASKQLTAVFSPRLLDLSLIVCVVHVCSEDPVTPDRRATFYQSMQCKCSTQWSCMPSDFMQDVEARHSKSCNTSRQYQEKLSNGMEQQSQHAMHETGTELWGGQDM